MTSPCHSCRSCGASYLFPQLQLLPQRRAHTPLYSGERRLVADMAVTMLGISSGACHAGHGCTSGPHMCVFALAPRAAAGFGSNSDSATAARKHKTVQRSSDRSRVLRSAAPESELQPAVTGPVQVYTLEQLTSVERQPTPLWSTFCGTSGGCWQGTVAAFSPTTGEPEAVALNASGCKLFDMQTVLVDERLDDNTFERRLQLAEAEGDLHLRGESSSSYDEADWDVELLTEDDTGFVVFDGGSYSRGPLTLGVVDLPLQRSHEIGGESDAVSPPSRDMTASRPDQHSNGSTLSDERPEYTGADAFEWSAQTGAATSEATLDDPDPQQTTVIEQCVAWGGELRVRVQITLACAELIENEELDLEVLRIAVFREAWECLTDNDACSLRETVVPLSGSPAINQEQLSGDYKVFDLSAIPIDETDPYTGETKQVLLHFSQETLQRWGAPQAQPQDGAALWLPGRLLVQLRMVPAASRGNEADASEGLDPSAQPPGLLVSVGWLAADGVVSLVEREYDGHGTLTEVRARTAVKGGWVGGRM